MCTVVRLLFVPLALVGYAINFSHGFILSLSGSFLWLSSGPAAGIQGGNGGPRLILFTP